MKEKMLWNPRTLPCVEKSSTKLQGNYPDRRQICGLFWKSRQAHLLKHLSCPRWSLLRYLNQSKKNFVSCLTAHAGLGRRWQSKHPDRYWTLQCSRLSLLHKTAMLTESNRNHLKTVSLTVMKCNNKLVEGNRVMQSMDFAIFQWKNFERKTKLNEYCQIWLKWNKKRSLVFIAHVLTKGSSPYSMNYTMA